jgi:hypothetical protein
LSRCYGGHFKFPLIFKFETIVKNILTKWYYVNLCMAVILWSRHKIKTNYITDQLILSKFQTIIANTKIYD